MKNKNQIIYIWSFIILASFILLLLYTPLGGGLKQPSTKLYKTMNKSVQFGGAITHSPKIKSSQHNKAAETEILAASDLPSYTRKTKVSRNKIKNQSSTYAVISKTSKNSKSNSASGIGGSLTLIGSKESSNSGGSENAYANNVRQPFSNESLNTNPLRKSPMDDSEVSKHDPGGDPKGKPLPVGDGILFLMASAILYAFYKYKKKLRIS